MKEEDELEFFIKRIDDTRKKMVIYYRISRLEKIFCEFWGITLEDMYGASRRRDIVMARHMFMYVLYDKQKTKNLAKIGQQFGGRGHAAVIHAVNKIEGWIFDTKYPDIRALYNELIKTIETKTEEESNAL